ncbi:MAG TPA: hypothetical protein VG604_00190 [Candidatus Saccharimonadales bacterium]|nr:hypothetical protein [Candidatus Saccharimonadales bacterium]
MQHKANQVWRRRQCLNCQAIFTSLESPDYFTAWLVKTTNGKYLPFDRDKLLLSLYTACEHRPTALGDSRALASTVIQKLQPAVVDGHLAAETIIRSAQVTLNRFDKAAAVRYAALHKN